MQCCTATGFAFCIFLIMPFLFDLLLNKLVLFSSDHSMPLQIMQYRGEEAEHKYVFGNKSTMSSTEPLMATVVLYLSDSTSGGEMLFPESKVRGSKTFYFLITMGCWDISSLLLLPFYSLWKRKMQIVSLNFWNNFHFKLSISSNWTLDFLECCNFYPSFSFR